MNIRNLALALAVAAAACTTDFSTEDDTGNGSDVTGDVDSDGTDVPPDGADVPDGPPDLRVVCSVERSAYVMFDGVELEYGCESDNCYDLSLFIGFGGPDRLVAIS